MMRLCVMREEALRCWYAEELAEAFPPNERKPLEEIEGLIQEGVYHVLGLFKGADLVGYAAILERPGADYVLLDYLGVTKGRRNGGMGAALLRHVEARYVDRPGVITEAEAPVPDGSEEENELRHRRIGFYRCNGFAPVYEIGACGARFQALLLGPVPASLEKLMEDHRTLYGPRRTDVRVPLESGKTPESPDWMK